MHDNSSPDARFFYGEKKQGQMERLLRIGDLNAEDSVLKVYEKRFSGTRYFPFARCVDGDILCHDYHGETPSVVCWSQDEGQFSVVKRSFDRVLHYLRFQ
ncbi:hypothetical protein ACFOUO_01655 [Salinithrix halophila]|uniref:Uncharacterized protein n=1 Tax=Salinithrix halophila TaxID=1485204 RepID=A0ABV8J9E9_9BACL